MEGESFGYEEAKGFQKPEVTEIAQTPLKGAANPFIPKFEEFFSTLEYKKKIEKLAHEYPQNRSLIVDFNDLDSFDYQLAEELLAHPDLLMEAARFAVQKIEVPVLQLEKFAPNVRFRGLPKDKSPLVRDISAAQLGKLFSVEGVIRQVTEVMPKLKSATWRCKRCGNQYVLDQDGHQQRKPAFCNCKHRDFELVPEESSFVDYQKIQIQEPLEMLKGSEQAVNLDVYIEDDFVNRVYPGNRTQITGILRLYPPNKDKKNVYGRYLEAIHLEETEKEFEDVTINEEDEEKIKEIAKNPKIYDILVQSIAPTIHGHDIAKESISLQLFGGVKKTLPGDTKIRGNIHVLLVGDPGTGKCVSGDTIVPLSNGELMPISTIVDQMLNQNQHAMADGMYAVMQQAVELPILSEDVRQIRGKAVAASKRKPEKMFKITTQSGKTLQCTHTHPIFTSRMAKVKAVAAQELHAGDYVAAPRKITLHTKPQILIPVAKGKTNAIHITFPTQTSFEFGQWVGLQLGEGYSNGESGSTKFSFTNSDKENLALFEKRSKELFGLTQSINRSKETSDVYTLPNVELYRFIQANAPEMLHSSRERTIPKIILKSDLQTVKGFIQTFMEGEAHVQALRKNGKRQSTIEVSSASQQLIQELSHLLLRFGIISTIKETWKMATNGARIKRPYWRLTIGSEFAQKYAREIGFITERKKKASQELYIEKTNTNIDVVPNIGSELKRIRERVGLSQFQVGIQRTTYQHYERGDRSPTRGKLYLIAQEFMDEYTRKGFTDVQLRHDIINLMKLSMSDIFWDKIVSVEEIPCEEYVYDIEVEGTHNFISNGIYSHNSILLQATDKIAPKSVYVSGKGSSSAGLTASAVKDDFGEGGWTLKAGALVLASGGMVMVDEFDKMEPEDRSAMHEAMEQGMVSVAKAGMVTRFKTDTSVLAAANPKLSRFDKFKPFFEQIDLPPSLISRFDLFFMIHDTLNKERDQLIASHILTSHKVGEQMLQMQRAGKKGYTEEMRLMEEKVTPIIDIALLRKYIAYSRQRVFPILSMEATQLIQDFYVGLRDQGRQQGSYAATARQLEGLVRLAEASARVRLSDEVMREDAERAMRLVRASLEDVVKDPETGRIDIDIVTSGQTQSSRDHMRTITDIIRSKSKEMDKVPIQDVVAEALSRGIEEEKVRELISKLKKAGDIYEPSHGFLKAM